MMGREDWAGLASRLDIASGLFIEGQYVNARSGKTFDCLNPATDQIIAKVAQGDAADIDLAVASAQAALRDGRWRSLAPRTRASILLRLADLVEVHTQELALLETLDMGKPISDVLNIDMPEVVNTLRYFAECIDKIEGGVTATTGGHLAHHHPRAIGRGRRHHAVELPADDGRVEAGAGTGRGQLRGAQTRRAGTPVVHPAGSAVCRRRWPARRVQRGQWPGTRSGQGAGAASRCGQAHLHRVDRGGQTAAGLCRAVQHETGGA